MAGKKRDYKAEERRRNELAKQRGFTSRAAQRTAQRKGEVKLVRTGATFRVEKPRPSSSRPNSSPTRRKTYRDKTTIYGYTFSKKQASADYSVFAARTEMAMYQPERAAELGVTESAYTEAYFNAFINPDTAYASHRYDDGGSDAMRYWFVDLNDFMEADEYDDKYGDSAN